MIRKWHTTKGIEIHLYEDHLIRFGGHIGNRAYELPVDFEEFFFRPFPVVPDPRAQYEISKVIADMDFDFDQFHLHFEWHVELYRSLPEDFSIVDFTIIPVSDEFELEISILGSRLIDLQTRSVASTQSINSLFFAGPDLTPAGFYPELELQVEIREKVTEIIGSFAREHENLMFPLILYGELVHEEEWDYKIEEGREFEHIHVVNDMIALSGGLYGDQYSGGSHRLNLPMIRYYGDRYPFSSRMLRFLPEIRERIRMKQIDPESGVTLWKSIHA